MQQPTNSEIQEAQRGYEMDVTFKGTYARILQKTVLSLAITTSAHCFSRIEHCGQ